MEGARLRDESSDMVVRKEGSFGQLVTMSNPYMNGRAHHLLSPVRGTYDRNGEVKYTFIIMSAKHCLCSTATWRFRSTSPSRKSSFLREIRDSPRCSLIEEQAPVCEIV